MFRMARAHTFIISTAIVFVTCAITPCHADLRADALAAAKKATSFLHDKVATRGGYLWRYSADLKLREGEGVVDTQTVWTQPPGTPSVGEAFVRLYEATGDTLFRDAARDAAEALRLGQMRSGGWQAYVEFDADRRKKWAYRTEPEGDKRKDQSSLDDDKTQSSLRFVIQLDRALDFKDAAVHEMAMYALDGLLTKGQFPNGGFPQVWNGEPRDAKDYPVKPASYPETWSREYTGHHEYWLRYTLNDNLMPDVIDALYLAADTYGDKRYAAAAEKAAGFLLLAQMPEPQPAWAQQYDYDMHPIWARRFEPASVTGGESQGVISALMHVYRRTGDRKYIEPIPRALDYLEKSKLPDGRLARFYEMKTNKPLYFTHDDSQLTYDDSDMSTHYGFKVPSKLDKLRREYEKVSKLRADELLEKQGPGRMTSGMEREVREVIKAMDERGAWVTDDGLRYHKKPGPVIDMRVTVNNLNTLAEYLAASR
ncbi:MAG: pectic acid lyase [Phycisphaera sp.]|nr:pectic acid lyase [Phycisphaera sp.]